MLSDNRPVIVRILERLARSTFEGLTVAVAQTVETYVLLTHALLLRHDETVALVDTLICKDFDTVVVILAITLSVETALALLDTRGDNVKMATLGDDDLDISMTEGLDITLFDKKLDCVGITLSVIRPVSLFLFVRLAKAIVLLTVAELQALVRYESLTCDVLL